MEISRIRYFLAVCEHGGFSAAAKMCGVSQPAVTTGVGRLERAVGGKLFERRRPVRLTPLGLELRPLFDAVQCLADRMAFVVAQRSVTALEVGEASQDKKTNHSLSEAG